MPGGLAAVPPAQLPSKYSDVVKIALQPRQTRALILAATTWHLLLTSALLKIVSISLISPVTLAVSLISFAFGVLPLLATQKRTLSRITTPPARIALSRAQQLTAALSCSSNLHCMYQHVVAFIVLALGYTALLMTQTGGWAPQIWVESHGSFYLNERFLYLIAQAIILGAFYSILFRSLPSPQIAAAPRFDAAALSSDTIVNIKDRVVAAFGFRLPKAIAAAALTSTISLVLYSIIRIRVWSAVLLVIGTRGLTRRLLVPSFRIDFGLFEVWIRTTLFSIAAVCAVETAYLLLDVYLSQPLPPVSKFAKNPNRLLLDGMDEPIVFFSNHAFSEMARLCANDKESRALIYRDVNSDVTAWAHIRGRCLAVLDAQKQFVIRRGEPAPITKPAVSASSPSTAPQQQKTGAAPPTPSIWDQLAAGQTESKQGAALTQAGSASLATNTAGAVASTPPANTVCLFRFESIRNAIMRVITLAWGLLPADAKHVLFGPRRRQALLGESPALGAWSILGHDAARVVAATLILKELLCHSLTEDTYGCVQKDIKRVLVAVVDLDSEMRRFGVELEQQAITIDNRLNELEAGVNSGFGGKSGNESQQGAESENEMKSDKRRDCQVKLREAWKKDGAESVDLCLTASIREILDRFSRFDLQLGTELEIKLAECLN
ncbi:uncharacterized protein MEPE_06809 [Melanopsichium pennsylvanicum]|uniref:Nucleoporin protein Ndc1-Nup n=2 Tax=Melanopsichium pennsylvanicum TaxID=63383 RepID=A0AAJ4XTE2_9BASI|nr:conserved hypothetical protein [Melanopsichium pennsylvanicum 4]SNX88098.1 uncharacterized protein MEPE_06809 [Melanopsichium pennsylvanicum]